MNKKSEYMKIDLNFFFENFPLQPNIPDQVSDEIILSLSTAFPITCSAFSARFETFDIFFTAASPSNTNSVKLISERFSYIFFLGYEFEVRTLPNQRYIYTHFDVCSVFLMFGTFQQKQKTKFIMRTVYLTADILYRKR